MLERWENGLYNTLCGESAQAFPQIESDSRKRKKKSDSGLRNSKEESQIGEQGSEHAWPSESPMFILRVMGKPLMGFKKGRRIISFVTEKQHPSSFREENGMEGDMLGSGTRKEAGTISYSYHVRDDGGLGLVGQWWWASLRIFLKIF